jgi:hypothetical protein
VLRTALERRPFDPELLGALAEDRRAAGEPRAALEYARRLQALLPGQPEVARLVRELELELR